MRKPIDLDIELIVELFDSGISYQNLALRFDVSKGTIKRRIFEAKGKQKADPKVLSFAAKLAKLVAEAPDGFCRKETNRLVQFLRTQQAASKDSKYQKIIDSINSWAREVEEIAEDCLFSKAETLQLLGEMIELGKIETRENVGSQTRGRKKIHYFIKRSATIQRSNSHLSFPPANRPIPASL
jgi:hypothetical protein